MFAKTKHLVIVPRRSGEYLKFARIDLRLVRKKKTAPQAKNHKSCDRLLDLLKVELHFSASRAGIIDLVHVVQKT